MTPPEIAALVSDWYDSNSFRTFKSIRPGEIT